MITSLTAGDNNEQRRLKIGCLTGVATLTEKLSCMIFRIQTVSCIGDLRLACGDTVPVLAGTLLVVNTPWSLRNKGIISNTSAGAASSPFQKQRGRNYM